MSDLSLIIVGSSLVVCIVGSFIPQYHAMYSSKSSEGISSYFMFVASIGTVCSFVNGMIFYQDVILDCYHGHVDGLECYSEILGFIQITCLLIGILIQYILFIIYAKDLNDDDYMLIAFPDHVDNRERAINLFILHNVLFGAFFAIGIWFLIEELWAEEYAQIMGLIALIGGFIQYIPQIYKTYRYKIIGSLSLTTMFIQILGSYVWIVFLLFQQSSHYSTWVPFFASATLQLLLLLLCCWIKYIYKPTYTICQNEINP